MSRPLIAITPSSRKTGDRIADVSLGLPLRYARCIERVGGLPVVLPPTSNREVLNHVLTVARGLLLTGGGDVDARFLNERLPARLKRYIREIDLVRDEMELYLVRQARRRGIPILGICRGPQVINVALGGTLVMDIPAQVGRKIDHAPTKSKRDVAHEIAIDRDSRLASILRRQKLRTESSHHQSVDRPANGLRISARAADGVVEAIESMDDSFLLGVQFHPERMVSRTPGIFLLFKALIGAARIYRHRR